MESIVRGPWQETVTERDAQGGTRINRLAYEMCVLLAVRERLRSKELWVSGADRYRNPNEDLPADFARERETYYTALNLSRDAQTFIDQLKQEMEEELTRLNDGMESNEHVRILTKDGGWISLSPLPVQPEPANLTALKARMLERWPLTSLLDVFKEADLRTRFTDVFRSATAWENLDREVIQERLLLTLYGLGSNAGIKRMSAGQARTNYKDLLYIRRRYVTKDQLRAAIREVVKAIFRERQVHIWGEGTTACASDSKKFGAWDQNLMTEWHARYGGRGVMIYWHVDRKSTCIYSQLKRCSSSEAAAMIEGVDAGSTIVAVGSGATLLIDRDCTDIGVSEKSALRTSHEIVRRRIGSALSRVRIQNAEIKLPERPADFRANVDGNLFSAVRINADLSTEEELCLIVAVIGSELEDSAVLQKERTLFRQKDRVRSQVET